MMDATFEAWAVVDDKGRMVAEEGTRQVLIAIDRDDAYRLRGVLVSDSRAGTRVARVVVNVVEVVEGVTP